MAEELATMSEVDGDTATSALYRPLDPPRLDGRTSVTHAVYVGVELNDPSALAPRAELISFAEQNLGLHLTILPTRSSLGGALGCTATRHQGVPQVVCLWTAPRVMGTVIFNLERSRSLAWAAAQTRELRELVEREQV